MNYKLTKILWAMKGQEDEDVKRSIDLKLINDIFFLLLLDLLFDKMKIKFC